MLNNISRLVNLTRSRFLCLYICIIAVALFFRFWQLGSNPPSLYWEEVALGYDAFAILKTGHDVHNQFLPLVAFESFGDWKPSLYFYSLVPSLAIFGLTEWAVRFPSAMAGVWIAIGVGYFVRLLLSFDSSKTVADQRWAQLIATSVAAISPWAIIFSRGAWEANLATALILWGAISFLLAMRQEKLEKQPRWSLPLLVVSGTVLALSMYAYHSARVVAPAVGLGLLVTWHQLSGQSLKAFLLTRWHKMWLPALVVVVCLSPLIISLDNTQTQQRFNETNIFADLALLQHSQELQATAGHTWWSVLVYHRYVIYAQAVLQNALSHFSLDFLFVSGDVNIRHSIQFMGQLYHIELVFLLTGLYAVVKRYRRWGWLLGGWLLAGIFAASLTKAVPHALRILPTLPVWLTLIALGISEVFIQIRELIGQFKLKTNNWRLKVAVAAVILITAVYFGEVFLFWRHYSAVYPKQYAGAFQDGYQQMIEVVNGLALERPQLPIIITRDYGRPSVYYWFYSQIDPRRVQAAGTIAVQDQGEFLSFEQVSFPIKTEDIARSAIVATSPRTYKLLTGQTYDPQDSKLIFIRNASGEVVWLVFIYE